MAARTPTPSKYIGAEPKSFDADATRRTVPDDPIRLPSGMLACEGCGIAHDGPAILSVPHAHYPKVSVEFTRCPDCQRLADIAAGEERTLGSLYALAAVGVPAPEDPAPMVPWLAVVGSGATWMDPEAPTRGWCNPYPWAHVSLSHRTKIKEAFLLAMRNRVRLGAPALALAPPWGHACLFCGLGSLSMTPIEVARRGGRESAAHALWRRVLAQPTSFGGHGPEMVDGFLCPPCSEAADSVGAIGVRARSRAFAKYVSVHRSEKEAARVRMLLDHYDAVRLPGWVALGSRTPNPEPWAHIVVPEDEAS